MKSDISKAVEKLLSKSHWIPFTGCLIWTGTHDKDGYGFVRLNGKRALAHRVAYVHAKGMPKNFVCHTCDMPSCINPDHLYDGTNSQNMQDRTARGRAKMATGERHGSAKLTKVKVAAIREMASKGVTHKKIKETFGLRSTGHVSNVVTFKIWKD